MERLERFEKYKERLVLVAERAAARIIKECIPMEDEITENQARMLYGDRWLRKQKKYKIAHWRKVGTRIIYSRKDLDRIRQEEREPAKLIFKKK